MFIALLLSLMPFNVSAQHTLHYDRPATYFEETFVIGNGTLGGIVYGGVKEEKISLNDITLWTGMPDTKVFNPDGYKALPAIREALGREDYVSANKLQQKDQGHFSENYQPLGQLILTNMSGTDAVEYNRVLDIDNALANVCYTTSKGGYTREYFASAPDSVIVIRLTANGDEKINTRLGYHCQLMNIQKTNGKELVVDGYAAWSSKPEYADGDNSFQYDSSKGIHFRTIIHVENKDGELKSVGNSVMELTNCTEAVIYISNCTSFNGPDKHPVLEGKPYKKYVRARMNAAVAKGYDSLKNDHVADYTSLFSRFSIELGTTDSKIASLPTDVQLRNYTDKKECNPDLEELYMLYGRYLLISSSRTPMVPANLQGLWNESILPPWSCNYTVNINLEENYWPAEIANLGELHFPMLDFVKHLPITGKQTAKSYYAVDNGWCSGHNSDIWGMTNPVGEGSGNPQWANWTMGGTWMTTHIWEHYSFTQDKEYLREYYPTLKGAADFCLDWLIPLSSISKNAPAEEASCLITAPCTSPENNYIINGFVGSTLYGGTADLAMIRECLNDTRMAAIVMGEDAAYIRRIEDTLKRILPYKIGSNGSLQEWYHDWEDEDPRHRHQSHLFGLFPGHSITVGETPDLAKACKKALEIKGDETTGWSTGWRVNLQARLHEPEAAYHIYRKLLNYISPDGYEGPDRRGGGGTYPNLLDAHSPFQIDGNFGGTAGVIEMLVQSTDELSKNGNSIVESAQIELLPALPEAWKSEGSVKGVRCRGGYEVSFSWKNGKVTAMAIKSVRNNKSKVKVVLPQKKTQTITLKAGEVRTIRF